VNGDPNACKAVRTLGPNRRASRGRVKSTFSTSKDILEKLKAYHPLPGIVLEWRRISSALTKHVYPLQKEKVGTGTLTFFIQSTLENFFFQSVVYSPVIWRTALFIYTLKRTTFKVNGL
jgi:hypothetical protein